MNEKGFALVTVLLLGSISMVLIALGAYMVSQGTVVSGIQRRYQGEVERAAGAAELLLGELRVGTLTCTPAQALCVPNPNCTPGAMIYFPPALFTALDKPLDGSTLSACYLSYGPDDPVTPVNYLASFRVTSLSEGSESAIIDVVYQLQP